MRVWAVGEKWKEGYKEEEKGKQPDNERCVGKRKQAKKEEEYGKEEIERDGNHPG